MSGYGFGSFIEGAMRGVQRHEQDAETRQLREENRQTRALQRESLEGKVADERETRSRRKAYETDPSVTGAADAVGYYRARRDKALKMGDTAEFERTTAKLMEVEKKAFDADYDKAMRRFIGSQGVDYKALVDTYNKHWSDGATLDMVRNEDGSYDLTFSREGEEPATTRAKNWEDVGRVAMRMADPKSWVAMKDAEYKELLRRDTDIEKIRVKGDEDRKTATVRGEETRKTAVLRQTKNGGIAGDPAAVRTAKWQIEQLQKAENPATKKPYTESEATTLVLKADRGDVTAKDRLRHLGVLRRGQMPGDTTPVGPQLESDVATARGAPAADNDPLGLRK
jgi:hypothetical protein